MIWTAAASCFLSAFQLSLSLLQMVAVSPFHVFRSQASIRLIRPTGPTYNRPLSAHNLCSQSIYPHFLCMVHGQCEGAFSKRRPTCTIVHNIYTTYVWHCMYNNIYVGLYICMQSFVFKASKCFGVITLAMSQVQNSRSWCNHMPHLDSQENTSSMYCAILHALSLTLQPWRA